MTHKSKALGLGLGILLAVASACRSNGSSGTDGGGVTGDGGVGGSDGTGGGGDGGGPAVEANIYDITSGKVKEGANVTLRDVIVSAVDGYGQYTGDVFVQEAKGGAGSGIKLYKVQRADGGQVSDLKPGDHVKVEGAVKYFVPKGGFNDKKHPAKAHVKELENARVSRIGPGTPPAPAEVTVKDLTEDPNADTWEHVLVRVKDVAVTKEVNPQYGEFQVSGGFAVDDDLFPHTPKVGDCVTITGISVYFFAYRLNPRDAGDIEKGTACPTAKAVTISDVQDATSANHPADGTQVIVSGVVSAVDSTVSGTPPNAKYYGFWIQSESGGANSGIYVYYAWNDSSTTKPVLGESVEVKATYKEYKDAGSKDTVSELTDATFTSKGKAATEPKPETVAAADVANGGSKAEPYEGVLVKVENVEVVDQTKDSKGKVLGVKLKDSGLLVENDLFDFMAPTPLAAGAKLKSVSGVLHYSFGNFKILPRVSGDLVP